MNTTRAKAVRLNRQENDLINQWLVLNQSELEDKASREWVDMARQMFSFEITENLLYHRARKLGFKPGGRKPKAKAEVSNSALAELDVRVTQLEGLFQVVDMLESQLIELKKNILLHVEHVDSWFDGNKKRSNAMTNRLNKHGKALLEAGWITSDKEVKTYD